MDYFVIMKHSNEKETADEVIQEMRNIKESLAKAMEFDMDRIFEDARKRQAESDRVLLPVPPARPSARKKSRIAKNKIDKGAKTS